VAGTVRGSVVGRGARVEAGGEVRDSVLLPGSVVRAGATVERAILDDGVEVCGDASVGESGGDIALVGRRATVEPGTRLGGGARFPDPDD
jgi:glucose-1-phosphate adenylyltransferase